MHRSARQAEILRTLEASGSCTVASLVDRLAVSDETVRRDLKAMAERGLVARVHGGVTLPDLFGEPAFRSRMQRNAAEKQAIARLAAAQVRDGDSLMMDTGSTTAYVARALADHKDLLLVTNCTEIARTVARRGRNRVFLACGELRGDDGAIFGASALAYVERFKVRTAILSIGAIHLDDGFMDFHPEEAEFSQALMRRAGRTIVVADHSKLDRQAPVKVCDLEAVDMLITDRAPEGYWKRRLDEAGVALATSG